MYSAGTRSKSTTMGKCMWYPLHYRVRLFWVKMHGFKATASIIDNICKPNGNMKAYMYMYIFGSKELFFYAFLKKNLSPGDLFPVLQILSSSPQSFFICWRVNVGLAVLFLNIHWFRKSQVKIVRFFYNLGYHQFLTLGAIIPLTHAAVSGVQMIFLTN